MLAKTIAYGSYYFCGIYHSVYFANTFLKDKITIIIAQRLNTIADADKIIVLKDSEIIGMGTHQELLENNQEYIELAKSQGILE